MTNEEMKAKIASIKCFDDAYKMACEGGYQGSVKEFAALVESAADEIVTIDLDTMDRVAGGGLGDAWSAVTDTCSSTAEWLKKNRVLAMDIAGNLGVAIGTSAFAYKVHKHDAELRARDAGNKPVNLDISQNEYVAYEYNDILHINSDYEIWRH